MEISFFSFFFWWILMNNNNRTGPVSVRQPPRRWHGYEVHPEGRGKRQSSPSPADYRAPLSLSYPQISLLSCRRSDRLCNLKRNTILLFIAKKSKDPSFSRGHHNLACLHSNARCSPCTTQGLMGSGCDQVSVVKRRGNSSRCNQATDMRHVGQQVGVQFNTQLAHKQYFYINTLLNTFPKVKEGLF